MFRNIAITSTAGIVVALGSSPSLLPSCSIITSRVSRAWLGIGLGGILLGLA